MDPPESPAPAATLVTVPVPGNVCPAAKVTSPPMDKVPLMLVLPLPVTENFSAGFRGRRLQVQGASVQTANLEEWRNNAGSGYDPIAGIG